MCGTGDNAIDGVLVAPRNDRRKGNRQQGSWVD